MLDRVTQQVVCRVLVKDHGIYGKDGAGCESTYSASQIGRVYPFISRFLLPLLCLFLL